MSDAVQTKTKPGNLFANLAVYALLLAAGWYAFNWWINDKVSSDAAEKYEIALRNGDSGTACFQAGVAAASYLSAKNEESYRKWRLIEAQSCAR